MSRPHSPHENLDGTTELSPGSGARASLEGGEDDAKALRVTASLAFVTAAAAAQPAAGDATARVATARFVESQREAVQSTRVRGMASIAVVLLACALAQARARVRCDQLVCVVRLIFGYLSAAALRCVVCVCGGGGAFAFVHVCGCACACVGVYTCG